MEEVRQYLKDNLKIKLHYEGNNKIVAFLLLEGEEISKDFIYYKNGI